MKHDRFGLTAIRARDLANSLFGKDDTDIKQIVKYALAQNATFKAVFKETAKAQGIDITAHLRKKNKKNKKAKQAIA